MKKLLLVAAIAVFGMGVSNAQDGSFGIGLRAAVPIGDAGDLASFGVGLEAMYMHSLSDEFMVGGSLGYTTYFTDDVEILGATVEVDDVAFLPINLKAVYSFGDSGFGLGADVGYAVGMDDGNDGGLLYEPKVVFNTETLMFSLGYQGIAVEDNSWDSIQIGAAYKF